MTPLILAIVSALIPIGMMVWARRRRRPGPAPCHLSPVSQQHLELFQGAKLSETSLETTKSLYRQLLGKGELRKVEQSMNPGTRYVVQVRALTEIGTEAAARILERQLHCRQCDDPLEQAWYWLDLANGLRSLNRRRSLPRLIKCAAQAEAPLAHFLAAETACFPGFHEQLDTNREVALLVLQRALEGLRFGVQPQAFAAGRFAEMIERVWSAFHDDFHPLAVRAFTAALRWQRRCRYAERLVPAEQQRHFAKQVRRLDSMSDSLAEYLEAAPAELIAQMRAGGELRETLNAIAELRFDATDTVIPLLTTRRLTWSAELASVLAHSRSGHVRTLLLTEVRRRLKKPLWRRLVAQSRDRDADPDRLLPALFAALRRHMDKNAERLCIEAAGSKERAVRFAAVECLGWCTSISDDGLSELHEARSGVDADIAHCAEAALARLGDCRALQSFRQRLAAEDAQTVHAALDWIGRAGLVLLWPEIDCLTEAENAEIAFHAAETLEQMREQMPTSATQ